MTDAELRTLEKIKNMTQTLSQYVDLMICLECNFRLCNLNKTETHLATCKADINKYTLIFISRLAKNSMNRLRHMLLTQKANQLL